VETNADAEGELIMRIIHRGDTLNITEVSELSARNCDRFRSELEPLLPCSRRIRIDLSETDFMDCRGVSTLLALQRMGSSGGRSLTVLNPKLCVRRIIGLTGLGGIVTPDEAASPALEESRALEAIAAALNPGPMPVRVSVAGPGAAVGDPRGLPARRSVPAGENALPVPAVSPLPVSSV
jgi:anti-anti-sigma factor